MKVRIWGEKRIHRFFRSEPDVRLARTRCGLLFAWTSYTIPKEYGTGGFCPACFL